MGTDNHTDISHGAAATHDVLNAPLGQLDAAIGNLATLTTNPKTSVVGALGTTALGTTATTVSGAIAEHETQLGDLTTLSTTPKTSVAGAIGATALGTTATTISGAIGELTGRVAALEGSVTPGSTYYVRATGDDGTGDGTTGAPWLTIGHALSAIYVAHPAGGDTILVGDGVYLENTLGGYFYVNGMKFTTWVTIQPENGATGDVTVEGSASADFEIRLNDSHHLRFKWLKFTARAGTIQGLVTFRQGLIHDIDFVSCTFTRNVAETNVWTFVNVVAGTSSANQFFNILFDTCTFTKSSTGVSHGIFLGNTAAGAVCRDVTIRDCVMTGITGAGVYQFVTEAAGVTNTIIDGGTLTGGTSWGAVRLEGGTGHQVIDAVMTSASYGLKIGMDADTSAVAVTVLVQRCQITSTASHGLLVGAGSVGSQVLDSLIIGGDQGAVIKSNTGNIFLRNTVRGGTTNCFYFKGGSANLARFNKVISDAGGTGVRFGQNGSAVKVAGCEFSYNDVWQFTATAALSLATADIDTGNVVNFNSYSALGGGTLGDVYVTTGITTIAGLRAAWDAYDVVTNDEGSRVIA
jgi:hypothetical protein